MTLTPDLVHEAVRRFTAPDGIFSVTERQVAGLTRRVFTHAAPTVLDILTSGRGHTGADFLVFAATWDQKHTAPPQLMGQLLHLFESPNRFGLPAFYTLHVWAWKENPNGTFVNWHPNVSCDAFTPQNH